MLCYSQYIFRKKGEYLMRKEYEAPKAEELDFDYSEVVTASNTGTGCMIAGMTTTYSDGSGNTYQTSVPGDE